MGIKIQRCGKSPRHNVRVGVLVAGSDVKVCLLVHSRVVVSRRTSPRTPPGSWEEKAVSSADDVVGILNCLTVTAVSRPDRTCAVARVVCALHCANSSSGGGGSSSGGGGSSSGGGGSTSGGGGSSSGGGGSSSGGGEIGDRLPNVDQVERTRKMTSVSFHNLLNQLGEANWLLCENNSDPDLASLSTYPQRTDMVVPVGDENDLGTFGEDIPFLSRYDVIEFFTDLCSEEDGNRGSECSDDSSSCGESAGWMSGGSPSDVSPIPSPLPSPAAEVTTDDAKLCCRIARDKPSCCGKRPRTTYARRRRKHKSQQMWQFILETLNNDNYNPDLITWVDRDAGVFKFVQSKRVAQLWYRKRGGANTFEHFSRSLRHYYKKGIMSRIPNKRLVYKFESNAIDWVRLVQSSETSVKIEH
ncbi:hypothetical protein LSAT2_001481 [Lamellibrachia satsuma]|nr:hypothetical protein LSAT2_001481 [Lamellibrachia satsuma]